MKKEEIIKKLDSLQHQIHNERQRRHEDIRREWDSNNEIGKKCWELNNILSFHRSEIDNLMQRIYLLEEQIKRINGKL